MQQHQFTIYDLCTYKQNQSLLFMQRYSLPTNILKIRPLNQFHNPCKSSLILFSFRNARHETQPTNETRRLADLWKGKQRIRVNVNVGISQTTFRHCRVHFYAFFLDNLCRNSYISEVMPEAEKLCKKRTVGLTNLL